MILLSTLNYFHVLLLLVHLQIRASCRCRICYLTSSECTRSTPAVESTSKPQSRGSHRKSRRRSLDQAQRQTLSGLLEKAGCMRKGSGSFDLEWLWLKCSLKPGKTSQATKSKQSVWKLKRNRKMHLATSNCHFYLRSNQEVSISNLERNKNNLMRIKVHVVEDYEMIEPITILSSVKWSWLLWNAFHQLASIFVCSHQNMKPCPTESEY